MKLSDRGIAAAESATMAISAKAKKMMREGLDVVNFGVGEPDFDTPLHIREAAVRALDEGQTRYTPVAGIEPLREAVAAAANRQYGLDFTKNNVVISGGAKNSIYNTFIALLDCGDEIIIPSPCWVSYPEMAKLCGAVPVMVEAPEENNFLPTAQQIRSAITGKTRAILINNPCNPTGALYPRKLLEEIAQIAIEHDIWVISDEIYDVFTYEGRQPVCFAALSKEAAEHAIIINGVSKSYAMTGWRIGWSLAPQQCAKVISNIQSQVTSCPNSIAQHAAYDALTGSQEEREAMRREFEHRRNFVVQETNSIDGISALKPQGAFYLFINISSLLGKSIDGRVIDNSMAFADALLHREYVAAVPGSAFGAEGYIRICYALDMEHLRAGMLGIRRFTQSLISGD